MSSDVHVERQRLGAQQVVVDRGDLEATLEQLRHHGVDLGLQEHEVAHRHRHVPHRLERDPAAEREGADGW